MKMFRSIIMALSATLILIPAVAGADSASNFHVTGTIHGNGAPDVSCRGFFYTHTGSLNGTLGPVAWTGDECVDLVAQPGGFTITGRFSLNDGLLTGTFEATGGPPDATGRIRESGTFSITEGSGAFDGALGSGTIAIIAQPLAGIAEVELAGAITVHKGA